MEENQIEWGNQDQNIEHLETQEKHIIVWKVEDIL